MSPHKLLILVIFAFVLNPAAALSTQSNSGKIVTRTRLVAVFSELQDQWLDAVKKKNTVALDKLLSEDYQVWTPDRPTPLPRDEWQAKAFAEKLQSYEVRDMAVRSVREDVAVESFRLTESTLRRGAPVRQSFFVVNIWTMESGSWRCTDTYISQTHNRPSPSPDLRPSVH